MTYVYRSNRTQSGASHYGRTNQRKSRSNRSGEYIDPSRFVKAATFDITEPYKPTHVFSDFALDPLLQRNLTDKGYTIPSPIQDQAINAALEGKDVIGVAGTGTGKTAAFALPLLQQLISTQNSAALIIAPTRELAQQIEEECRSLAKGSGLRSALLIGGSSMSTQLRDLRESPRVIIGTPGRIKDHQKRGTLKLHRCNIVVLDEVDRMLDMGFINDVKHILSGTSEKRQILLFSATIDPKIQNLIQNFTHDPITISLDGSHASENVHQDVLRYSTSKDKLDILHDVLLREDVLKAIIFDETQRSVERLSKELIDRGFSADAIHGGRSQGQRKRALDRFRKTEVKILVATDVAARGIDVADITHVINFSTPKAYDDYIHRIGRAGRANQIGYALTFVPH